MVQRRAVFLIGYMGAGKTSVGRFLAQQLHWQFIDLDDKVEARSGQRISDFFANKGEPAFRQLEADALAEVVSELTTGEPSVVALGGGAFANHANAALLEHFGAPVVWLDAPVPELWERTQGGGAHTRPLRTNMDEFEKRYQDRLPSYSSCNFRVDTSGKSVAEVAAEVAWLMTIGSACPREEQ